MNSRKRKKHYMLWFLSIAVSVFAVCVGLNYFLTEDVPDKREKPIEDHGSDSPKNEKKEPTVAERIQAYMADMTLEEKAAQIFMTTPEQLTGVETVIQAGETTKKALEEYPLGGVVYFKQNLKDENQTKKMIEATQSYGKTPLFIGIDEEGGSLVARIGNNDGFSVEQFPNMMEIGKTGNLDEAYRVGTTIGGYLSELGFNIDFAPIADVLSNPENQVIGARSFGPDAELDGQMVSQVVKGLQEQKVISVLKHFPGHGNTQGDSHEKAVVNDQTLEGLHQTEFIPFKAGIEAGAECIMVGHISLPQVTKEDLPASLSKEVVTDILRGQLGFDGVVFTDSMSMGAVTNYYTPEEAAVMAVNAGCDILLMSQDFKAAYQGILDAVNNETLTEERLDESVFRILKCKEKNNIINI